MTSIGSLANDVISKLEKNERRLVKPGEMDIHDVEDSLIDSEPDWVSGSFTNCGTVVSVGNMPSQEGSKALLEKMGCPSTVCPNKISCRAENVTQDDRADEAARSVYEAICAGLSKRQYITYISTNLNTSSGIALEDLIYTAS